MEHTPDEISFALADNLQPVHFRYAICSLPQQITELAQVIGSVKMTQNYNQWQYIQKQSWIATGQKCGYSI